MRRTIGVGRRHECRNGSGCDIVGRPERRCEGTEVDVETEVAHGIDGGQDVAAGLTLDEWFDGELDLQHAPSVIGQSRPITLRSSPARTLQSRPATSKASARRVRAERKVPFHSPSKA